MLLFWRRGRSNWYLTAQHVCFQKSHIGVTVYLILNGLILGILSHGYVTYILGYNNFYANIGQVLFNLVTQN